MNQNSYGMHFELKNIVNFIWTHGFGDCFLFLQLVYTVLVLVVINVTDFISYRRRNKGNTKLRCSEQEWESGRQMKVEKVWRRVGLFGAM